MYERDIETHLVVSAQLRAFKKAMSTLSDSVFASWPSNSKASRLVAQLSGRVNKLRLELELDYEETCDEEDHERHGKLYDPMFRIRPASSSEAETLEEEKDCASSLEKTRPFHELSGDHSP